MGQYRLKKEERLSGKKRVEELFHNGNSFFHPPFRVIWGIGDAGVPVRMAVAVSKKSFKHAVRRNLIKRRIREAYRRNKNILTRRQRDTGTTLDVIFVYTGTRILSYREIEEKIIVILRKIRENNEKAAD